MQFGIIGSGSWATALAKILTDSHHSINWWVRSSSTIEHLQQRRHNPHYLPTAYFNTAFLNISDSITYVIKHSDVLVIAVPSAHIRDVLIDLPADIFQNKKIVSAIKGMLPDGNELLNDFLENNFDFELKNYFTVLGPCHAEEVASEKLSYLTFSGADEAAAKEISLHFKTFYLNTIVNHDIIGVQYAAVLKNIYALGAGIAHGLEYGDNFLSVYIANSADEMVGFLKKMAAMSPVCKTDKNINYAASVYLGDLLVTCYSLFSRNRMFGNMIGKGYSVKAAQLELNMVAEGYNASKCIFTANEKLKAEIPIANTIYEILWHHLQPVHGFGKIESLLM